MTLSRRLLNVAGAGGPSWDDTVAAMSPYAWWKLNDGDYYSDNTDVSANDATGNARTGRFIGDQVPLRWRDPLAAGSGYSIKLGTGFANDLRTKTSGDGIPLAGITGGSFTLGWWIAGTTATVITNFVAGGNYFYIALNHNLVTAATAAGHISWLCSTAGADAHALDSGAVGWNDGDPHLVLFEYNSVADTISIWFDGTKVATKSHAGITMPTTHTNAILASAGTGTVDWRLDEYLFFNRLLTTDEHAALAAFAGPGVHPFGPSWAPPYNTASHLEIPVPGAATTEAMHPDVIDMGAAWHGYRYWMSFTPYNGDPNAEEPCVVATNDITAGGTWEVPAGGSNPVTTDPGGATHPADTDLIYDPVSDRLYLLYVMDDNSTFQDIRSKSSADGITWSSEVTVLAGAAHTYGNPSCVKTATGFRLYYNIGNAPGLYFRDTTDEPDNGYGAQTACTGATPLYFQNLNMVRDTDGTLVAVISDAVTAGGVGGRLFFARSTDGGTNFAYTGGPVLEPSAAGWDQSGIYRTSVMTTPDGVVVIDAGLLHVWYSGFINAVAPNAQWGTAYIRPPREVLRGLAV